ncbi:MAG: transposase [Planctomycetes bacterium]|nr:transposase [Planctomycetota bacterium]
MITQFHDHQELRSRRRELKDDKYYHIVNRGVVKRKTFRDEEDYDIFLRLLKIGCKQFKVRLIAFSLMPNHFHLLVWSIRGEDISACMQWVTGNYARLFNVRYGLDGHVWEGRFKSKEVQEGRQLGNTWRYVEQNPVRARLVDSPEKWEWTSAYVRAHNAEESFLTEPPWWGSEIMKKWWSTQRLIPEELEKIRRSLQKNTLLDSLLESC